MLEGRRQLADIVPSVRFAIADSRFNEQELVELGCKRTAVAPILVDFADYDAAPDATVLARRRRARQPGGTDWLAVGRIAPNKCQHDIVLAFAAFRRLHDPLARLTLVGGQSAGEYWRALHRLAADLGIADAVHVHRRGQPRRAARVLPHRRRPALPLRARGLQRAGPRGDVFRRPGRRVRGGRRPRYRRRRGPAPHRQGPARRGERRRAPTLGRSAAHAVSSTRAGGVSSTSRSRTLVRS